MNERPLAPTPGQTVGPFFGYALPFPGSAEVVPAHHPDAVRLHGRVLDGAGQPVPDALLEIWQADGQGQVPQLAGSLHRDGYGFTGWGRCATDNVGAYNFSTLVPRRTDGPPFIALTVFARGLMHRLLTRIYLPGSPGLDQDPFLSSIDPQRRATLVAVPDAPASLLFDVHLQGERETVFLSFPPSAKLGG